MVSVLLIVFIVFLYSFQTLFCRLYNNRYPGGKDVAPYVYCVFYGLFVSAVTWMVAGFRFAPSRETWLCGLANGIVLFGYNYSLIQATALGSYAVANFCLLSGGILIPLVQSVCFYNSQFTYLQYAGIAVMIFAFLFLNLDGLRGEKGQKRKVGLFPLFCALLFLCNGMYGSLLYAQQSAMAGAQREEMIIVTFMTTALLGFIAVIAKKGMRFAECFRQTRQSSLHLLACCASAATALNLLMYLMTYVNVAILYTVENGGVLLVSVFYAVLLFKERLTFSKKIGILLALASLVMLGAATGA